MAERKQKPTTEGETEVLIYKIIVKKLNSLKHLVSTTVAESHN